MTTESAVRRPLGLVLAGGLARRMGGGDKAAASAIGGATILDARARRGCAPQCTALILNANGDPARFADTGLPVVADDVPDFAGPLAGILAGLDWAAAHAPGHRLTSPACRATARSCRAIWSRGCMQARAAAGMPLACARSGEWRHPVVGLWPVALRADLRQALTEEGLRKIEVWTARHGVALADWPAEPVDPFFNVNTPEDAAAAERIAAQHPRRLNALDCMRRCSS